jgi:serine/threonine protein kinase
VRGLERPGQRGASGGVAIQGYTILKELGRGGMGSVWLARHEQTGRLAAVKVMLPQVAADERHVKRFLLEMHNTRILNHANVVRVEDYGFSAGVFYLTLEYCEGGSAADLMKRHGGTAPLDQAVKITLQALEGLHYAHNVFGPGRGLVHRDLKPANLRLSGAGRDCVVKVGDYGLAKAFGDAGLGGMTRTDDRMGTPGFTARAQVIDFKRATPEVDVWAMAASLYCMLTGAPPRDFPPGRDPWSIVLESPAVPIRQRKAWLPARLAEVIDRALVEQPEIPFKTAAAFKKALEGAL